MEPPEGSYLCLTVLMMFLALDQSVVIALATRKITNKVTSKIIILLGVVTAVAMLGIATLGLIQVVDTFPLKLIGGVVLIALIVWQNWKSKKEKPEKSSFWGVMAVISIANMVMSIDNSLALAGFAYNSQMMWYGVAIDLPILLILSFTAECLVKRFKILFSIATSILAGMAIYLIATDNLVSYAHPIIAAIAVGIGVFAVELVKIQKARILSETKKHETRFARKEVYS